MAQVGTPKRGRIQRVNATHTRTNATKSKISLGMTIDKCDARARRYNNMVLF